MLVLSWNYQPSACIIILLFGVEVKRGQGIFQVEAMNAIIVIYMRR
jgi:hypothetical protein